MNRTKNPKKTLIRNVEVPLSSANAKTIVKKCDQIRKELRSENVQVTAGPSNTRKSMNVAELQTRYNKFSKPEPNTCLELSEKIKNIKQMKIKPIETEGDLTPKSKQLYRHEITKVLNLPVHKKIYHHLIPLNVNDSVIQIKEKSKRQTYTPGTGTHVDLEPQLEYFLTSIEPIKIIFPISEEMDVIPKTDTRANFDILQNLYTVFGPDA